MAYKFDKSLMVLATSMDTEVNKIAKKGKIISMNIFPNKKAGFFDIFYVYQEPTKIQKIAQRVHKKP